MTRRHYLEVTVRIACVEDENLDDAMLRLRAAVETAFPPEYDSDVEVEAECSAGLFSPDEGLTDSDAVLSFAVVDREHGLSDAPTA